MTNRRELVSINCPTVASTKYISRIPHALENDTWQLFSQMEAPFSNKKRRYSPKTNGWNLKIPPTKGERRNINPNHLFIFWVQNVRNLGSVLYPEISNYLSSSNFQKTTIQNKKNRGMGFRFCHFFTWKTRGFLRKPTPRLPPLVKQIANANDQALDLGKTADRSVCLCIRIYIEIKRWMDGWIGR